MKQCAICHQEIADDDDSHHDNIVMGPAEWPWPSDPRWPDDAIFHADCCPLCKEDQP